MSDDQSGFMGGSLSHLFRANPQAQQTVSMLSALYKSMAPLYDPDGALMRDPDAWGKVQLDDRFRAFIQQRVAKVGRIEFVIEPATDAIEDVFAAATVEPFMRAIPAFSSARRHLAKFAFHGRSHAWIEGRREWRVAGRSEMFPDGLLAEWWAPTFIRPLDKRQIIYQPRRVKGLDGSDVVSVKTLLGTIDAGKHVEMENPECLITCVFDDEVERLGYGRGLLETLYHAYWIKGVVRRLMLSGIEKWAHGILVGKIDAAARAAQDTTSAATATAMLNLLSSMRAGGTVVVDKSDEIEVLTPGEGATDAMLKVLGYIDDGASQLCLAAVRPMGGGEGGPYKQVGAEQASSEDLLDGDRELIDEQISRSVLRLFMDLNASPMAAMGLGAARCPVFRSRGVTSEDAEKVARVYEAAQRLGVKIGAAEAHRRLGVKRPAKGEDILEAPKAEPSSIFGGGSPFGSPAKGGEGGVGGGRPEGIPRSDKPEGGGPEELSARRFFDAVLRPFGLELRKSA